MAVDAVRAAIPAVISTIGGFAIAFYIFKFSFGKKYGELRSTSRHANIFWWSGLVASFLSSNSLIQILGEPAYLIFNEGNFKVEKLVFHPTLIFIYYVSAIVIAWILTKIISENPIFPSEFDQDSNVKNNKENFVASSKKSQNSIIIFLLFIIGILISYNFLSSNLLKISDEKVFDLKNCMHCSNADCKNSDNFKGFKVTRTQVYVFLKNDDGQSGIGIYPNNDKMKCAIVPERNFMFDCNSLINDSSIFLQTNLSFDGNEKFKYSQMSKISNSTASALNSNWQCEIK